ncbi:hypothetical protein CBL_01819 [Carabus blaptoides fortunei]
MEKEKMQPFVSLSGFWERRKKLSPLFADVEPETNKICPLPDGKTSIYGRQCSIFITLIGFTICHIWVKSDKSKYNEFRHSPDTIVFCECLYVPLAIVKSSTERLIASVYCSIASRPVADVFLCSGSVIPTVIFKTQVVAVAYFMWSAVPPSPIATHPKT